MAEMLVQAVFYLSLIVGITQETFSKMRPPLAQDLTLLTN